MEGTPENAEGHDNSQSPQENPATTTQIKEALPNQPGTDEHETNQDQHPVDKDEGLSFNEVTRAERQQIQDAIDEMFSDLDKLPPNLQEEQLSQYRDMAQDLLWSSIGQQVFKGLLNVNPDPFTGEFGLLLQSRVMDKEYRNGMTNINMSEALKDVLNRVFPPDRNRNMDKYLEMADKFEPTTQAEQPKVDNTVSNDQANNPPNPSQQ